MSLRYSRIESSACPWKRPIRALTLVWLGTTLILAATGPFGSFTLGNFAARTAYWASVVAFSIALSVSLRSLLKHALGRDRNPVLVDAVMLPLFTLLYTPPLFYFNERVSNLDQPFTLWQTGLVVLSVSVSMLVLREALGVSLLGIAPQWGWVKSEAGAAGMPDPGPAPDAQAPSSGETAQPATETAEDGPDAPDAVVAVGTDGGPALLQRLPEDKRGELHALSSDDHYVQVHTERGPSSVLLRFADALRELGDWPGLRIHRSHWVADAAVQRIRIERGRLFVVLRCGRELPVSRTYADAVRDRWGGTAV